jgi:uncharacterized lipoprotein YajG
MKLIALTAAAGAAALLAGCATPLDTPLSPQLGQAVASMNAQIIPAAVSDEPPESSAARSAAAVRRYEQGKVKEPATTRTSGIEISPEPQSSGGVDKP